MRRFCTCWIACGALLLVTLGCGQSVNIEKKVTLEPGEMLAPALVDAPKREQKINVEFTSSESPINVFVVLGKDDSAVMKELDKAVPGKLDIVAKAEKSKGETLMATIPAGKDYGVYLTNALKKTQVTVKVKTP